MRATAGTSRHYKGVPSEVPDGNPFETPKALKILCAAAQKTISLPNRKSLKTRAAAKADRPFHKVWLPEQAWFTAAGHGSPELILSFGK
jgi:hypothetical protein